jgi:hypothetical protein
VAAGGGSMVSPRLGGRGESTGVPKSQNSVVIQCGCLLPSRIRGRLGHVHPIRRTRPSRSSHTSAGKGVRIPPGQAKIRRAARHRARYVHGQANVRGCGATDVLVSDDLRVVTSSAQRVEQPPRGAVGHRRLRRLGPAHERELGPRLVSGKPHIQRRAIPELLGGNVFAAKRSDVRIPRASASKVDPALAGPMTRRRRAVRRADMRPMLHPRRAGLDGQRNGTNDPLPQGAKRWMLARAHGRLIPRFQRMSVDQRARDRSAIARYLPCVTASHARLTRKVPAVRGL